MVTIINLCAVGGYCFLPILKKSFYKHVLMFMVSLAVGALSANGILVLIPEVIINNLVKIQLLLFFYLCLVTKYFHKHWNFKILWLRQSLGRVDDDEFEVLNLYFGRTTSYKSHGTPITHQWAYLNPMFLISGAWASQGKWWAGWKLHLADVVCHCWEKHNLY